jgi:hypothetical protein
VFTLTSDNGTHSDSRVDGSSRTGYSAVALRINPHLCYTRTRPCKMRFTWRSLLFPVGDAQIDGTSCVTENRDGNFVGSME